MSYAVQLTDTAKAKLASWGLSPRLVYLIDCRLHEDLAAAPQQHLVRVRGLADCLQYSFVESDAGSEHLFVFTVVYGTDEETLVVVECEHLSEPAE